MPVTAERANKKHLRINASALLMEAASGFEPLNKGFADLCLTTWLRRHIDPIKLSDQQKAFIPFLSRRVNEENPLSGRCPGPDGRRSGLHGTDIRRYKRVIPLRQCLLQRFMQ